MSSSLFLTTNDTNLLLYELLKRNNSGWGIRFTGNSFILSGKVKKITTLNLTINIDITGYRDGYVYFCCKEIKSDKFDFVVNMLVNLFQKTISKHLPKSIKLNYPNGTIYLKDLVFKDEKIFDKNISIENIEINNGVLINFNLINLDFIISKSHLYKTLKKGKKGQRNKKRRNIAR